MFGFLNIDKPLGITSHDVVAQVRRLLHIKKVGHAGTLDPLATGVLIVAVGGATRLTDYVMHQTKQYRARVKFGIVTTTYDAEGQVTASVSAEHITLDDIQAVLPRFIGEIDQVPPMYSAIKQGGQKLYDLARAGVEVERAARHITIHDIQIIEYAPPELIIDVTCSAGTYIRSLAFDLGAALGVGAHLSGLIRTSSGRFMLDEAVTLEALAVASDATAYLISPQTALIDWQMVVLDDAAQDHLLHGRSIPVQGGAQAITAMGYNNAGRLIAILEAHGDVWKPSKVFPPTDD